MFFFLTFIFAFFGVSLGIAQAAPLAAAFTFIGGLFSAGGLSGLLMKGLLYVGLSYGASLIQKALQPKQKATQLGSEISVKMGDDQPATIPFGYSAVGGRRKYIGTYGDDGDTPNAYLVDVVEFSSMPTTGNPVIWDGDQKLTVFLDQPHPDGRGYPVSEYRRDGKDYMWVKWYLGDQTEADPYLRRLFGGNQRPWKSTMVGFGTSYAIFTCRFERDIFANGVPQWLFEPKSIALYDLRKDSTIGGNGNHRWSDPSTWEPSDNPVVQIYNIIRGVRYGNQWMVGGQNVGVHRLPVENWIAAANACDIIVPSDNEKSFRSGFTYSVDSVPIEIIQEILNGCNGRIAEVGGFFKISIGSPGASVFGFNDESIVVTNDQELDPFPQLTETYNGIECEYPEPRERWATKDAPPRHMANLETEDGNRRLPASITLPTVPYANQVQRVMLAMINDYRRFRIHRIVLPPEAYVLEPNDVVSWTSQRNGYINKQFVVIDTEIQKNLCVVVTIKEVDSSDYDWNSSDKIPTSTGWVGTITPPPQYVKGWTVSPATLVDADGDPRRPSIRVSCSDEQDGVTHIWVQVRVKETQEVMYDSDGIVYASPFSWILDGDFWPNTEFEVRGRYISVLNPNQNWSDWLTVLTPDVKLSVFKDVDLGDISDLIPEVDEWFNWNTRESIEEARRNILLDIDQDSSNFLDKQQVRRELSSVYGTAQANWTEDIVVMTGPNSALALKLEELSVKVDQDIAEAITLIEAKITVVDGRVTSNTNSINSLTSRVDDVESNITIRGETSASPGDGWARWGVQVKVSQGNDWSSGAFFIDVRDGMSRFVVNADQFVIASGGNTTHPFVFQGDTAYMENARIGTVYFNQLSSLNGKLILRGSGNLADIRLFT